jgi:hypothetical protein
VISLQRAILKCLRAVTSQLHEESELRHAQTICDMECDITPPKGGDSWRSIVVDGEQRISYKSLIRRILIDLR